jgi:MbtH protein
VIYQVIVNDEGQYALHPAELEPPDGWHPDGWTGSEEACIAYVDERWTDLRPLRSRGPRRSGARR